MEKGRVPTGSPDLDDLLGGGLERRTISQIYGEAGSGKSTLCLMCAVSVLATGKSVLYIDTEGFSADRFRQIAGDATEELAEHLLIFEPVDFEQQAIMIGECEVISKIRDVGLIVVDSVTALYRTEGGAGGDAQRRLGNQVIRLLGYAKRFGFPVLLTNQVYMDVETDTLRGLGGTGLHHISKAIVRVSKRDGTREAVLEKHRSLPENRSFIFEIVEKGIKRV
ncbi:MAG: DNA repair and recombination protein RadB [Methanomicrobiaceae archaeon]|nr:DNA repair and recombination protein RadB [Methanomicrobiaceae archaeon]